MNANHHDRPGVVREPFARFCKTQLPVTQTYHPIAGIGGERAIVGSICLSAGA
jgi:hypothetical protein